MTQWNDASVNNKTTYTYGNRNQIKTNTGYFRGGTTSTGAMTYAFDIKGNMTSQSGTGVGSTFEWTNDNRLKKVTVASGTSLQEAGKLAPQTVNYRYDHAGRRVLKDVNNGQRTRYFFNGLTEEIKKVSVGTHADTAFAFVSREDGGGSWGVPGDGTASTVYDDERFSDVKELTKTGCTAGNFTRSSFSSTTNRSASFWIKNQNTGCPPMVGFTCSTSAGTRHVELFLGSGTSSYSGGYYFVYLNRNTTDWQRVEVELGAIIPALTPGVTLSSVTGLYACGRSFRLDDVRLSNSMTVEHNTLGPGVIGHILRNRTINVASSYIPSAADRWFHYDQVGSVMSETNASGALAKTHYPDAFGNRMASWTSGLWTNTYGERKGWGHNSKEFDGDTGLVYMYQRWYSPELGLFGSRAPYEPMMEHQFGSGEQNPVRTIDPSGEFPATLPAYALPIAGPLFPTIALTPPGAAIIGATIGISIGLAIGDDVAKQLFPDKPRKRRSKRDCESQLNADMAVCNSLPCPPEDHPEKSYMNYRFIACRGQAMNRYAACLTGKPIPPFPYP